MKQEIRELDFDGKYCFYSLKHLDRAVFLNMLTSKLRMTFGNLWDLGVENVEHTWFRPLSPTEAEARGYDYGVEETSAPVDGKAHRGCYPVTMVVVE